MGVPDDDAVVELVELVILAISEDEGLCDWFRALGKLPHNLRENAILQITSSMAESDEDPELIRAVGRLQHPEFHQIVARTLEDLSNEQ
jgi:hypothetical protein